jgi:serine O-acetyltransferase
MEKLNDFIDMLHRKQYADDLTLPCKPDVNGFVNDSIELLFPMNKPRSRDACHLRFNDVALQLDKLLCTLKANMDHKPSFVRDAFFDAIPAIYEQLLDDAEAIYRFDPAAGSIREVVNAYPGFFAIAVYRFAHSIHGLGVPILPRMMAEYAHSVTGIDIHPGAQIGDSFFIDHGTGVVIGETTAIGNHVKIYQGVTLGALSVEKSLASTKRHPTIENNVVIYAGSTVLGGKTVIGHDSVIGGNVWLTESVPPYSVVYHTSQVKIRSSKEYQEPINFSI